MPISFGSGEGSGLPYIRFKPSVNEWTKSAEGGAEEFEPKSAPMVIDIERMVMGWLLIEPGNKDWKPWASLSARTKKPEGDYKVGFVVHVYSKNLLGPDVHEFSANNVACTSFIEALYNACEAKFGTGQVPVVQIKGSKSIAIGKGNTREVQFEVVKWIDRPEPLNEMSSPPMDDSPPFETSKSTAQFADAEF